MNSGKNKILLIIIGFLLITNIGMLIFFVLPSDKDEHRRHHHKSFAETLKEDVHFTDSQYLQYQERRNDQKKLVRSQFRNLRSEKEDFFNLLYLQNAPDSLIQSYADSIGNQQAKLDLLMLDYFQDLRSIATAEQVTAFDTAVKKALYRMIGPPPGKKKDSKEQKKK